MREERKKNSEELFVCGGCNAKIGAGALGDLLAGLPRLRDDRLLVGFDSADDAAVIRLSDDLALIQTIDFFPTPVTDPYLFGRIAAANALSDVYAMGGMPLTALNVVAFPEDKSIDALKEILRGGAETVAAAGAILSGGHSIHDKTVKYGLAVTGTVHPDGLWRNHTAQEGDVLILTKRLGVSIICTGFGAGEIGCEAYEEATAQMATLNRAAAEVFARHTIHACTDVTGFGFLGHLSEMTAGRLTARIRAADVPRFEEAYEGARNFILTAGGQRNRNHVSSRVAFEIDDFAAEEVLFDPQTSGGLLAAVAEREAQGILRELNEAGTTAAVVGTMSAYEGRDIIVS